MSQVEASKGEFVMAESREKSEQLRQEFEQRAVKQGRATSIQPKNGEYADATTRTAWNFTEWAYRKGVEAGRRDALEEQQWIIVADGEGAEACVIVGGDLHEAAHNFMCCCGKPWRECECGREMIQDIEQIDDPDAWALDEAGEKFSTSWPHETGMLKLYKLSKPKVAIRALKEKGE